MARNKTNILARGFTGSLGKQFVLRTKGDRTILANLPGERTSTTVSPEAEAVRVKFKESVVYAKNAMKDPELKLQYKATAPPGRSAFNMAFSDAYLGPVISNLRTEEYKGLAGDKIIVRVVDNFFVDKVKFSIIHPDGTLLEEGPATINPNALDWSYTVSLNNAALTGTIIRVTAEDLPGNVTVFEKTL